MLPFITVGNGPALHYIRGYDLKTLGYTLNVDSAKTYPHGESDATTGPDWGTYYYGGLASYLPGAYANHKAGAFYYGKFYRAVLYQYGVGYGFAFVRFDGSGIFKNKGTYFENNSWANGRGYEFISPSGTDAGLPNIDISIKEPGFCHYNGVLYIAAKLIRDQANRTNTQWITKSGWDLPSDSVSADATAVKRRYKIFAVKIDPDTQKEKKVAALASTDFNGNMTHSTYGNACDMIGYNGDIYFATWVDIIRARGGSGTISLIDNTTLPTAKSFLVYPASGYTNSVPQGSEKLFCLTGSGVLKKIILPSGTTSVYNLKTKIDNDIRATGPWARVLNATAEPGRSSLLLNYQKKLHAFVISAISGYHYLTCNGNPASGSNWTDQTETVPYDLRAHDGNVFGYVDEYRDKMYVMHTTFSEIGHFGYGGGQKSAGGVNIWQVNPSNNWTLIHESVVGGPPKSLIPYQNLGPYVHIASGSNPRVYQASDYAIIEYYLYDHYKRNVDVKIEYSDDLGMTWNTARRFKSYTPGSGLLGDAIVNLATSPEGIKYDFYWDYVNDISFNQIKECMIRITPKLTR